MRGTARIRVTVKAMIMDSEKRKVLEAAGWRFGDAADFLELTDEERQLLDARIEAAMSCNGIDPPAPV